MFVCHNYYKYPLETETMHVAYACTYVYVPITYIHTFYVTEFKMVENLKIK